MKNARNQRKLELEKFKVAKLNDLQQIKGGRAPLAKSHRPTCPVTQE